MYSLNINTTNITENLELYMLNSIKNSSSSSSTIIENGIKENKLKGEKFLIPRSNIYVNYNKFKSKYYEKPIKKNLVLTDKLFWCFYKLYNNINDNDLEYINLFSTEKEFKLAVIQKINENKDLLKKHKIQKNSVETEFTNNKVISLTAFKTLCILYNLNVIVLKDNNTYARFTNNNLESCIDNLDSYYAIKLIYKDSSIINTNFQIITNINKCEIQDALNKYYYVKNLEKPLKSFSSYKLDEIIEIGKKLEIPIFHDNNKKKTKMEIYSDSLKKLS